MSGIDYFISEAETFLNDRKPKQALEWALKALNIDAASPEANMLAGIACYRLRNKKHALKYFEKCLPKVKTLPEWMNMYAVALSYNNRNSDALEVFKEIVTNFLDFTEIYFNYGHCLMMEEKWAEAILEYDKAEACGYAGGELYFDRGACKFNLQEFATAEIDLLKACELKPDHVQAVFALGEIKMKKGLWEKAVEYFSQVLFFDPSHHKALTQRLMARIQIKDKNGLIVNREGAQADADKIIEFEIPFMSAQSKEGKKLEIMKLEIGEQGQVNIGVRPVE